jgi:hypothetical protein
MLQSIGPSQLDALRFYAPLNGLSGIILLLGIIGSGLRFSRFDWLRSCLGRFESLRVPAALALVLNLTALASYCVCALHLAPLWTLRLAGGVLAIYGCYSVPAIFRFSYRLVRLQLASGWANWIVLALLGLLLVACLAPPTEPDALDYHLSAPVRWLVHGGIRHDDWWMSYREANVGEGLVALGLSVGSDIFGQLCSWLGLVLILAGMTALCRLVIQDRHGEVNSPAVTSSSVKESLMRLLVLSAPLWLYYVATPKAQTLGLACVLLGLVLWLDLLAPYSVNRAALNNKHGIVLIGLLWGGAAAYKHSFIVPLAIISLTSLLIVPRAKLLGTARKLAGAAGVALVVAAPLYLTNWILYANPISPVFSGLFHAPAQVTAFYKYQREFSSASGLIGLLRHLWHSAIPRSAGDVSMVLGPVLLVTLVAGILVGLSRGKGTLNLKLALLSLALVLAALLLLPQEPRYLLEPALLAGALVIASSGPRLMLILRAFSLASVSLVMAGALISVFTLAPGAINERLRDRVLTQSAYEYAMWKWATPYVANAPAVLSDGKVRLFAPVPVLSAWVFRVPFPETEHDYNRLADYGYRRQEAVTAFAQEAQRQRVEYAVGSGEVMPLIANCSVPVAENSVVDGRRSPFNRKMTRAYVRRIDWTLQSCAQYVNARNISEMPQPSR